MLERHYSSNRINEIVNHPTILPWIRGSQSYVDLSSVVESPNHIFLVGEHGCVHFIKRQPGIWEFHTSVLPEGRGQWMLDGAKEAFHWMFTKTDAFELMTPCPDGNIASKAGARAVGCSFNFRTKEIWEFKDKMVCLDIWSIVIQNWIKTASGLVETGKLFHDLLEKKYGVSGKLLHDDDETHNRYVGFAVEAIKSGYVAKAISMYNRWAIMSGFQEISVVSLDPLVVDIQEARLRVRDNDFEIEPCQKQQQPLEVSLD